MRATSGPRAALRPRAMANSDLITVEHLMKRYGPHMAVRDVSFSVGEGEVIGLLGPNGSGKSTIMRILTGFLPPSAGEARIAGLDVIHNSLAVRRRVGYVPEDAPLYNGMRVREFLRFMAEIKGLSGTAARKAVAAVCDRLDLDAVATKPIGALSRGYRQRVAIAQALVNDPPVLILDEPTNALDAYHVIGVRDLIRSLAGRRTVLVASHVLSEIERVASRIMILVEGKLLTADALQEGARARRLRLRIAGPPPAILAVLGQVSGVVGIEVESASPERNSSPNSLPQGERAGAATYLVTAASGAEIAPDIARAVIGQGFGLSELVEPPPNLEQVFLDLTRRVRESEDKAA